MADPRGYQCAGLVLPADEWVPCFRAGHTCPAYQANRTVARGFVTVTYRCPCCGDHGSSVCQPVEQGEPEDVPVDVRAGIARCGSALGGAAGDGGMTRDHHPPCLGGCGQLADECACNRPNPLGSMRIEEARAVRHLANAWGRASLPLDELPDWTDLDRCECGHFRGDHGEPGRPWPWEICLAGECKCVEFKLTTNRRTGVGVYADECGGVPTQPARDLEREPDAPSPVAGTLAVPEVRSIAVALLAWCDDERAERGVLGAILGRLKGGESPRDEAPPLVRLVHPGECF